MSRGTWVSGAGSRSPLSYRAVTFCGQPFQAVWLGERFLTPRRCRTSARPDPVTPTAQRARAITCRRFRLFPFRSPLLGESRLLSLPQGTEMFQFPWFASRPYGFRPG